jgi:hypothetical protein
MRAELPKSRFTVYAILLSDKVLESRKFLEANPNYVRGMACFYVGMTAKSPAERFEQHLAGYKSNRFAHLYGLRLMPPSFTLIKPRTYEEACRLERKIAERMGRKGFGVWQN